MKIPPDIKLRPALLVRADGAVRAQEGGEEMLSRADAQKLLKEGGIIVCHAAFTARRLNIAKPPVGLFKGLFDIMELFAFTHPARACIPTPQGLARALHLDAPARADLLHRALASLFDSLRHLPEPARQHAAPIARRMERAGWSWGKDVCTLLGADDSPFAPENSIAACPEWSWDDTPPQPHKPAEPISAAEIDARLQRLLGPRAETRAMQTRYAHAVADVFAPVDKASSASRVALAEAGTGLGKTAGYLAPASLYAEAHRTPVWIATYTRNLQKQVAREAAGLFEDPDEASRHIVVRKGRENYLCLRNFAIRASLPADAILIGLVARWLQHTQDGDIRGGDFPTWLAPAAHDAYALANLTDNNNECTHSACPHYRRCFVERAKHAAHRATLVVANHALVMTQARQRLTSEQAQEGPARIIFDEGHHLFDAADSAFCFHLGVQETARLRRWILGSGGNTGGLDTRLGDEQDEKARAALDALALHARDLPAPRWVERMDAHAPEGKAEVFFAALRAHVYERQNRADMSYSLEARTQPCAPKLLTAAQTFRETLAALAQAARRLTEALRTRAEDEDTDKQARTQTDAMIRALAQRMGDVPVWQSMLAELSTPPDKEKDETPEHVDWFTLTRRDGREANIVMHRHWIDPTLPFTRALLSPSEGALITSATLRDMQSDIESDMESDENNDLGWQAAEIRTGANHLPVPARRSGFASPFDYAACTRAFIITDVAREDMDAVANAFRTLFLAAQGGALGLFTAIRRLKSIHGRLAGPLARAGLLLLAQHIDAIDRGTLVDVFCDDEDSCLLGTDALRDGIDVPGRALRLIVFDRVPWPRPDILHEARAARFGHRRYSDMLTRFRLHQAFGRLIRKEGDRGVFVMLDPGLPTRIAAAFPPGIVCRRVSLTDAEAEIREFLKA